MGTFHAAQAGRLDEGHDAAFVDGHRRVPSLVQWMVTGRCSGACDHCMTAAGRRTAEMDGQAADRFLDDLSSMGVEELLLTGGEPLERPDLPEVVRAIERRGLRWSLNTARSPGAELLRAMRAWPPCFVAVSLDGPARVHDRIRGWTGAFEEALSAIRVFADLTGGNVAAGTTVSSRTFPHLAETFAVVMESGASSWGLHLVVPEGRASRRADLLLSREEVRRLVRFAARKRKYFPVTMADEVGHCGTWEPLVRDTPFFCGAGRTHCVVLPDGDVVPCTTFDRSECAGNVTERPLSEIWPVAFARLRRGVLDGSCRACRLAEACGGGCWLQRRHGVHCYRESWDQRAWSSSAGLAVCLGLASCAKQPPPPDAAASPAPVEVPAVAPDASAGASAHAPAPDVPTPRGPVANDVDAVLMRWYAARLQGETALPGARAWLDEHLAGDPARPFVERVLTGTPPPGWPRRAGQVRAATGSSQRSLHLVSLLWRDVATWCFDGPSVDRRSEADRRLLAETMAVLASTTSGWREEIFAAKLDPFLRRDEPAYRRSFLSKAGPPRHLVSAMRSSRKHWGSDGSVELTREWLRAHPFAESMRLAVRIPSARPIRVAGRTAHGTVRLGLFDVIEVPPGSGPVVAQVAHRGAWLNVNLAEGAQVSHPDLLRLVYAQNDARLDADAAKAGSERSEPLLLPALRAEVRRLERTGPPDALRRARRRLLDAWLF